MYFYNQETDYIRCMCYVPISVIALSRFILHLMRKLKTDIYCGLTESWMLSFMNIPCFFIIIFLFVADFIIGFREKVPQPALVGLKCYMTLIYLMYARYYFGFFNLELQFSFFPIILEAIISGWIWDYSSDQITYQNRIFLLTFSAMIFQIIMYDIIFPKQTKDIVPLIYLPFSEEGRYRIPQNTKQESSKNKKSNKKKND